MEVWNELADCIKQLKEAIAEMPKKIIESALSEKNYRIAKAKKILELEKEGKAKTIITDLAKGDEQVADLCYKRDIAKDLLKVAFAFIEVKRSELSSLKMMYDKEYTNTK